MKIKGLTLIVVLSVFVSAAYGAGREKRKNGWQDNGLYGKVEMFAEQSYEEWTTNKKGERVGINKASDSFQLWYNRKGRNTAYESTFSGGTQVLKGRSKLLIYDHNAELLYVVKQRKSTPTYSLREYYDKNKKLVQVREDDMTDRLIRVVFRDLATGEETIGEYFFDEHRWLDRSVMTFPDGYKMESTVEYYSFDEQGNWLEAIQTITEDGYQREELQIRSYKYFK